MHHPKDRIAHTTAFVTPVMEHWLPDKKIALSVTVASPLFRKEMEGIGRAGSTYKKGW